MPDTHEFFTRQHEQLNRLETSVVKTRAELESARNEAMDSLKTKRNDAAATRESFQKRITESVDKMKASTEARRAETEATIEEWKRNRDVEKLENRADNLEEYADASMTVLNIAQEGARQASLDAIEARRQADEVKKGAGTPA
jgi:hypothetical protein